MTAAGMHAADKSALTNLEVTLTLSIVEPGLPRFFFQFCPLRLCKRQIELSIEGP